MVGYFSKVLTSDICISMSSMFNFKILPSRAVSCAKICILLGELNFSACI
jgi:hypothetical protein